MIEVSMITMNCAAAITVRLAHRRDDGCDVELCTRTSLLDL